MKFGDYKLGDIQAFSHFKRQKDMLTYIKFRDRRGYTIRTLSNSYT